GDAVFQTRRVIVHRQQAGSHRETCVLMIVPTLCVGMPLWTLGVRFVTRSVTGCIPTRSVGTISGMVTWPASA
ncbi:hypothetical protein ACW9IY_23670, partial [Pseudomonas gingeri]